MKIAFNRAIRRSPWGGGSQFLTVFADFLRDRGHDVSHALVPDLDWIVMLDPRHEDGGFGAEEIGRYKLEHPRVKVLHRINDTGVTRGGDAFDRLIMEGNLLADRTVFISAWVRDHFAAKGYELRRDTSVVIHNGCDERVFLPKSVVPMPLVTRPVKLVTHHWSDNPSKGSDLYRHIDELIGQGKIDATFTYVGRYPKLYLTGMGPSLVEVVPRHTRIVPPLYGKDLANELRAHDVYVTGARSEACGSHHVEGAACGLPVIYHKGGGGVVEMCSRYGEGIAQLHEFEEVLERIVTCYQRYREKVLATPLIAKLMCEEYMKVMP